MSENNSNPSMGQAVTNPAQAADLAAKQAGQEAKPISIDNMSGAEARAVVDRAKAEGKSVEQVLKEIQSGKADQSGQQKATQRGADGKFQSAQPKPESNQESVKAAAAEAKRRLKIDNEEVDEDEVIKIYKERKGHQRAANKELQEGKAARKQAEEFISMMRDPQKVQEVMTKLGYTRQQLRQMSEQLLAQELDEELMDPREKELRDAKNKLKAFEDMERQKLEQVQRQREHELKMKYQKEYETQFLEVLQKNELPQTKEVVGRMAKYIADSARIGFKMTPAEAAQMVKEDLEMLVRKVVGESDGEILLKLLGEQTANKIRKYDTSKVKNPNQVLQTPAQQAPREERRERGETNKRMTPQEWRLHKLGKK